ncbi:MAG: PAS domain S-box protein [Methanothrix sp.]|nr:PAS domain S-box protein [Methanothrix sp.]MDD5768615.1 PAS domain S-box protein [Methanothrix sp.]
MIRVLMVDDDPAMLEIAKIFLERSQDIRVDAIESAKEAMVKLKDGHYDVIVSDYVMPEMDGISFLKWVRRQDHDVPFILFTGKGREEVVIEALNHGADYYLQKDSNPQVLYAELTHQIRQAAERQKTKRAVLESEEKYKALFENMNEGFILYEFVRDGEEKPHDYIIRDANPKIKLIADLKPEEAIGKSASEIFRSKIVPFLDIYLKMDETGSPAKFEGYFPSNDRYFSISAFSIGKGEFATIFSDITEQKRMDEGLRRAHKQLQEIIDFLPDATFVIDQERKIIAWNRAIEEMTGVQKDEVMGRSVSSYIEAFYGFNRPILIDSIFSADGEMEGSYSRLGRKGDAIFAEVYVPSLYGGKGGYVWATASPLFDDQGQIVGAIESIRDVTERKIAEMALRETRDYMDNLLHYANAPITVWGPNMKIIRFNRAFERLTGYSAEEMIGQEASVLLPDEGREEAISEIAYTLRGECWDSVEIPIRCKNGGERIVLWNSANIYCEKDRTLMATIIQGQDITDRKRVEEKLIQATKQLLDIIDFLPDPTFVIDQERKVIAWNRAIEEMTGVSKEEIVGEGDYAYGEVFYGMKRPILIDMIFSRDEELESHYHHVKREGETLFAEAYVIPPRTGKGFYVWGTASPLFDGDGETVGAIESIRDVTEIKETEMALQENEERMKLVIEGANLGIWDWNLATGGVVRNRRLLEILGCPEASLAGHVWDQVRIIHPDDLEKVMAARRDHFDGKTKNYMTEYRLKQSDGRWIWVQDRGEVMERDEAGRPLRMAGITQDITEIRQYQEALKEANRKLNLLSSVTRHDIQNQITGLAGYALLLSEILPEDPPMRRYIDGVLELTETINRQVAFTRDYQDMGVKSPEWQPLEEVVGRAAEAVPLVVAKGPGGVAFAVEDGAEGIRVARGKGAGIEVEISTGPVEVFADPLLEKVFSNLLENATRHGGGVTKIRVSFVERGVVGEEGRGKDGGGGVIVVEDDGLGIAAEMKGRIFDQAFGRHTGYGLFLSREILGITGMTIFETGEEGKGARFEIDVPRENYRWCHTP